MMRRAIVAAVLLLTLAAPFGAAGQADARAARQEFNLGARAYREGKLAEARHRFERALALDPSNKNLPLLIARTIQQQYKPGGDDPENVAKGSEAVAAYERILAGDPSNEEAYKAIVSLHGQMKGDDALREFLLRRANNDALPAGKRAESLTLLASKYWRCSFDFTEQKENKEAQTEGGKVVVKYKQPADASGFLRARDCVGEGLSFSEQAVRLAPDNATAWEHRLNLLREAAKLAEMDGHTGAKEDYDRQHEEARQRYAEITGVPFEKPAAAGGQGDAGVGESQAGTGGDAQAVAAGGPVGVAECDEYLAAHEACVNEKVPEAARPAIKSNLERARYNWRQQAETPQGRAVVARACAAAREAARQSMTAYGCNF